MLSVSQLICPGNPIQGRSLGQGTFGKVRVGTHTITGEKVAIKILEKDRIESKSDVERVTREINILKKVRHPNVIQLYEVSIKTFNCSLDYRNFKITILDYGICIWRGTIRLHC
jgi:serine/threonine protein kinase